MHKLYFLIGLAALALTGCGNSAPQSLADLKGKSSADSMMYYFGEMQASAYWQDAETDTLLRTREAREEFMEGFRAAMGLDRESAAYNKGLQLGLRLGIRLREFEERYDMKFPVDVLAASLENNLREDHRDSVAEAQQGFYKIKDRLELGAASRELVVARQKLAREARERGYEMVSDTLYAIDVAPGAPGPKYKDGDKVGVYVTAYTLDGSEIVTRQFPETITIGAGRVPRVVCLGIHTMTSGQTRTFMTTPRTLFGKRYATYHLPYDEPVIFTVKVD